MVRVAIVALAFSGCLAEDDVYYHTQLLQTKVNPQKVAVDTTGEVQDDVALFQKSFSKKLHRQSKEAAQAKFFANMKDLKAHGRPKDGDRGGNGGGGRGGGGGGNGGGGNGGGGNGGPPPTYGGGGNGGPPPSSYGPPPGMSSSNPFGPPPPEAEQECITYYGEGVEVNKCWNCVMQSFMTMDEADWHPDPNVGFEKMCDSVDGCMGQTNVLTATCEAEYGADVALLDCLMCGMMCECESPNDCDMQCHQGCMSFDQEAWEDEEHHDADDSVGHDECKMFYGEDVTAEKCKECGEKCFEEAKDAESPEEFFNIMVRCSDDCHDRKNTISQKCEDGYGPQVDVFACFECGGYCGCDFEQCDHQCHGQCMTDDSFSSYSSYDWSDWSTYAPSGNWSSYGSSSWPSSYSTWPSSYSTWPSSSSWSSYWPTYSSYLLAKIQKAKTTDTTDLMQTSKHLK